MMRRLLTVALMGALAFAGFAPSANAGVVIDLTWRDTGTPTLTITPGDAGAVCNMGANNPAAAGRCLDITMVITNEFVTAGGVSVQFDSSTGLAFSQGFAWFGVTYSNSTGKGVFGPIGSRTAAISSPGIVSDFNGVQIPPNGPPALGPGTYKLGTILWNTSGVTLSSVLNSVLAPTIDQWANGDHVIIDNLVTFNSAFLNVPEPGTAALLGLGLVGLIAAGRRNRK